MFIYRITNIYQENPDFIVSDQYLVDEALANTEIKSIRVGTLDDANSILSINRAVWLANNTQLISTVKITSFDNNNPTWECVNLENESDNDDQSYVIYDMHTGKHNQVIGLANAKDEVANVINNSFISAQLDKVYELDSLPE
jgi:hypothetical protein